MALGLSTAGTVSGLPAAGGGRGGGGAAGWPAGKRTSEADSGPIFAKLQASSAPVRVSVEMMPCPHLQQEESTEGGWSVGGVRRTVGECEFPGALQLEAAALPPQWRYSPELCCRLVVDFRLGPWISCLQPRQVAASAGDRAGTSTVQQAPTCCPPAQGERSSSGNAVAGAGGKHSGCTGAPHPAGELRTNKEALEVDGRLAAVGLVVAQNDSGRQVGHVCWAEVRVCGGR